MKKDVRIFLMDILECIGKIEEYLQDVTEETFREETWIQDAVMRRLEIIGEAAKNVPEDFMQKHPGLPWREMARTRDKLIHAYFGVNPERVWIIAKEDLPGLKKKIEAILKAETRAE